MTELDAHDPRIGCAIYISPRAETGAPRLCVDLIGGTPLIVRTLTRLLRGVRGVTAAAVIGGEDALVRSVAERAGLVFFAAARTQIDGALSEWCDAHPEIDMVAVLPELSLFPDCAMATRLVQMLACTQSDCAIAAWYPFGLAPLVIRRTGVPAIEALFAERGPLAGRGDSMEALCELLASPRAEAHGVHVVRLERSEDTDLERQALPVQSVLSDRFTRAAAERVTYEPSGTVDATDARAFRQALDTMRSQPWPLMVHARPRATSSAGRVLCAASLNIFTGADRDVLALMTRLDSSRYEPILATEWPGVLASEASAAGIPVELAECESGWLTPTNLRYWNRLLTTYDIDLVHLDTRANAALMMAALHRGLPLVGRITMRVSPPLQPIWQCASVLLAASDRIAVSLRAAGYDPRKILRVHDGIDVSWFSHAPVSASDARRNFGLARGAFVVCMVTRIGERKRQELAVRAVHALRSRGMDASLLLVGDVESVPYAERLTRLAAELGVAEHVRAPGYLEDPRVAYAAADVLVVCFDSEGLGQFVLEGMAMGVPAVIPRSKMGPAELIRDGEEGLHYAANDVGDLSRQLERLYQPQLRAQMAERAQHRAKGFALDHYVARVAAVYDGLLTAGKPPAPEALTTMTAVGVAAGRG